MSHPIDSRIAEQATKIASLHAEVERLQFIEAAWIALKSESKYTPGGDFWPRAERVVELENEILKLRHERDEALAQVAVLLELCDRVQIAETPEEYLDDLVSMVEGDRVIKARALLDRLQRAEVVVEAAKTWAICCSLCGPAYSRVSGALAAYREQV